MKSTGFFKKITAFLTSFCFVAGSLLFPVSAVNLDLLSNSAFDRNNDQPYGSDLGKLGSQPVLTLSDHTYDLQLTAEESALRLYYLGLMSGNVSDDLLALDFALNDTLTRLEAVVMAVRLMGQDKAVQAMDLTHDYVDVPSWGAPYIAYAEATGIIEYLFPVKMVGIDEGNAFMPNSSVTLNQFMNLMLFILGYDYIKDGSGDYFANLAYTYADQLGTSAKDLISISRGDAAIIMFNLLRARMNGDNSDGGVSTLSDLCVMNGIIDYNDSIFLIWTDEEDAVATYLQITGRSEEPMLADGYYTITNQQSGFALNVLMSGTNSDYEGVGVSVWKKTDDITQTFRISRTERGTYYIYSAASRGGFNRVLGEQTSKKQTNTQIGLFQTTSKNAAEYYIKRAPTDNGGWYIIPANKDSMALTALNPSKNGGAIAYQIIDGSAEMQWQFNSLGLVSGAGEEYAIFPADVIDITQAAYGNYSHKKQNAIDCVTYAGSSFFAPFTGKVIKLNDAYNTILLESCSKVVYAGTDENGNPIRDYMTVAFLHDNYIGDIADGTIIPQGQYFYDMGVAGKATGDHVHLAVYRGKYREGMGYSGSGDTYAQDAFFILPDTVIRNSDKIFWTMINFG